MKNNISETVRFEKTIEIRQFPPHGICWPFVGNLALALQDDVGKAKKALNDLHRFFPNLSKVFIDFFPKRLEMRKFLWDQGLHGSNAQR